MNRAILLFLLLTSSGCASCGPPKACPTGLFPCHQGCIPASGVCCPDGSFCPNPQGCVSAGSKGGFTCAGSATNHACAPGTRHCDQACIQGSAPCCAGTDCTEPSALESAANICPAKEGFVLCGQCIGGGGGCQGVCRYCSSNSFCGGDICGDVHCCVGSACSTDTPTDCQGSQSGGGSCNADQHLASCPDGTQKCCSIHMLCCHDSANGGAVGCQFQGFCQ